MVSIVIKDGSGVVDKKRLEFIEEKLGVKLPESFINLIKDHDGGYPVKRLFDYYDEYFKEKITDGIGMFLTLLGHESHYESLLKNYQDPPEFFPEGLVAFALNGCGDLICFDYREGKDTKDPKIVFWNHGADFGKDVSFIANNFDEFLSMLYAPDD